MMGMNSYQKVPLQIVGSTKFGRTPKMSSEETYNMIISDGWFVPFGGYKAQIIGNQKGNGRAIYSSQNLSRLFFVVDNKVSYLGSGLALEFVGELATNSGDVFIAENNGNQIAISDKKNIYIYEPGATPPFTTLTSTALGFVPGNIVFQNERFITVDLSSNEWRLSEFPSTDPAHNGGLSWPNDPQHVGAVQQKAGKAMGVMPFPGEGNKLVVYGQNVGEIWQDVGLALFPYQLNETSNFDYGLANTATLAGDGDRLCWVGVNENSGPAIMYSLGTKDTRVSTDGIDERISEFLYPSDCFAFMLRLVGHLCYVVTWFKDNVTYLYDFNTDAFFTMCDENMNALVIKKVAYFDNQYWFVSIKDGSLYQLNSNFTSYDYGNGNTKEIPLIRVLPAFALEDSSAFIAHNPNFMIEQGNFNFQRPPIQSTLQAPYEYSIPRVDMTISVDGGENYSNAWPEEMQALGNRQSIFSWNDSLGRANDLTLQYRFHGFNGKFVVNNGSMGVYQ